MWQFDANSDAASWTQVDTPISGTLRDVADSAAGPCAVGAGGVVAGCGSDGWGIVVENGPAGQNATLHAVDATDDGRRLWFAGANGALGYYDHDEGVHRNFSSPHGIDSTIRALAVAGEFGSEKLLVADDSGTVLTGEANAGTVEWHRSPTPNASPTALTADADGVGYAVDTNGHAWRTTAEDGWEQIDVAAASGSLYAVCAARSLWVGGDNGRVFQRADGTWTPFTLGNFAVHALDGDETRLLAGGEGGRLSVRIDGGNWTTIDTGTDATVHGVLAAAGVAVGGNGTVLEARKKSE